ncbi:MAG: nucleotidyltransferase domain-containing protein [Spirochaetota bacterium]
METRTPNLALQASPCPDGVAIAFAREIREAFPANLRTIILFGSRARGDARIDSDYDFLILFDRVDPSIKDKVRDIEVSMMETYEALVSALVMMPEDWKRRSAFPIGLNVAREGIAV